MNDREALLNLIKSLANPQSWEFDRSRHVISEPVSDFLFRSDRWKCLLYFNAVDKKPWDFYQELLELLTNRNNNGQTREGNPDQDGRSSNEILPKRISDNCEG